MEEFQETEDVIEGIEDEKNSLQELNGNPSSLSDLDEHTLMSPSPNNVNSDASEIVDASYNLKKDGYIEGAADDDDDDDFGDFNAADSTNMTEVYDSNDVDTLLIDNTTSIPNDHVNTSPDIHSKNEEIPNRDAILFNDIDNTVTPHELVSDPDQLQHNDPIQYSEAADTTTTTEFVDCGVDTTDMNVMADAVPMEGENHFESDFGDFATSVPVQPSLEMNTNEEQINVDDKREDFSNLHETATLPITNENPPIAVEENDDDFGDFDAAENVDHMPTTHSVNPSGHDDFGNFDSVIPTTNQVTVIESNDDDDDDDDFGDFDTAEVPPATASSNNQVSVDDDDDDDFGDFDEAPATAPADSERFEESTAPQAINGLHDPIVEKLRTTFPNIFIRYAPNKISSIEEHDDSQQIPQFHEDEIVTIDSVLTSLEVDTPMKQKVLSQSSIYPIDKIFTIAANDADNVVTPSRFIISKNTIHSPTIYPLSGHAFVSDRMRRIRVMGVGELNVDESNMINGQRNAIDSIHQQNKNDAVEPSEQAKAFMERIPDLSYMLSSKLTIPAVK